MSADTTTPGRSVGGRRRVWAWMALAGFAGLLVAVVAVVVASGESLIGLVFTGVVCLLLGGAALWWAFTTRKVWKRWLNLALVVLVVVTLGISLVVFSLWQAAGVLAVVVAALAYGLAARRALAGAAPAAAVERPAAPPARPWLLVNPRSGDGTAGRVGLVDGARVRGISVQEFASGDDPATLAREAVAAGADAVGVAGGDGSLGLVAAVAVEFDVPFVCVPAGTRNHFAHDLGLDRADPLAALGAFSGPERRIDVAMVGDRMFLNNVSLGTYADVVAEPGYRARKLATAHSVLQAAVRGERARLAVEFTDPDGRLHEEVLVLLVANNAYQLQRASELGARDRLDEGVLQVSALRARTGAALARVLAKATVGRAGRGVAWAQWETAVLRVDSKLPELPAGVDGETVVLSTPLEFRILPRALRVLIPETLPPPAPRARPLSLSALRRLWVVAVGPRALTCVHERAARAATGGLAGLSQDLLHADSALSSRQPAPTTRSAGSANSSLVAGSRLLRDPCLVLNALAMPVGNTHVRCCTVHRSGRIATDRHSRTSVIGSQGAACARGRPTVPRWPLAP